MIDAGIVISIAAAGAAAASAVYAGRAVREARKANALPTLLDYLREYRHYERERRYVLRDLRSEQDPSLGISNLPDAAREKVLRVCHYIDQLGFLVDQGMIDPEAVAAYMGESILLNWAVLSPYIQVERAERQGDYSQYFEDLAARVFAIGPRTVRKRLRRLPEDAELPRPITRSASPIVERGHDRT